MKLKSISFAGAVALAALGAVNVATAGVVGVTSAGALSPTDSIDWGQLGPVGTTLSSPVSVTSTGGLSASVSSAGGTFVRLDQGNGWGGNFAPGEHLLWDAEQGPDITIDFAHPVKGAGAQIQADFYGDFTAEIIGSNGAVLGDFTEAGNSNGNADNSAIFIGLLSSAANISEIKFDLTTASNSPNDFAIGTLQIAGGVPEPATWALMLFGVGMIGGGLRIARRKNNMVLSAA